MRNILGWRAVVAPGFVGLIALLGAGADDPSSAEKQQLKRWSEQLHQSLGWYQVSSGRASREPMKPEIVHRWLNPVRRQKGETALIFWVDAGRPEALASAYPWGGGLVYECISLARTTGLEAKEGERSIWSPATPGITFHDVPDAPAPARTVQARLVQMKAIAEAFKVTMSNAPNGQDDREAMRLLPKPIHRTDPAAARGAHPDLIDAAAFAFVQGTDPEAVLLVEAIHRGDASLWRYAFGRATGYAVEAKLGSAVVWKAERQPRWNDPTLTGIALGRKLVD